MNLLITGAWSGAKEYIPEIEKQGHRVVFMQKESDTLPCVPEWVEGTVCNGLFLSHDIKQFSNLRYVQLTSAGFDRVPMEYIKVHNIEIRNARGVYSIPMSEFALCGVLQLYKQSRFFMDNQKRHKWEKHRGLLELFGKTVCIVGCGSVGTECAKRFSAFGCDVIGVDLYPSEDVQYREKFPLSRLDEVLPAADIIVLTLPLTDGTRHMINRDRLSLLKGTAVIVNIARGAVVDTEALIEALPHLGGAVLDVFEEEPLETDSLLWDMENIIVTPHNSFVGENNDCRLFQIVMENLKNLFVCASVKQYKAIIE